MEKTKQLELIVGDYPDADDWESHGVYNLLDYQGNLPDSFPEISRAKFREILRATSTNPELLRFTSPKRFEELIAELFNYHGYQTKCVGKTGDGGVDIYALQKQGVTPTLHLVQCKRYSGKVGVSHVRELYGVKADLGTSKAVLVTTSEFTRGAREFAEKNCWQIQLIDFDGIKTLLEPLAKQAERPGK